MSVGTVSFTVSSEKAERQLICDVYLHANFATSCKDGRTQFTFRVPSIEDADYAAKP